MDIIIIIIIALIAISISVILHEVVHGYVAQYLGDTTAKDQGRLTLNPFAHIDPIFTLGLPILLAVLQQPILGAAKPVPVEPSKLRGQEFGMALVAVMGPVTNLILAMVGGAIYGFVAVSNPLWDMWLQYFIQINIGFFIFNMLPIPPLDGSRVLYAFSPEPLQRLLEKLESFGFMIILLLVLLGMPFFGPIIVTIYEFIYSVIISIGR